MKPQDGATTVVLDHFDLAKCDDPNPRSKCLGNGLFGRPTCRERFRTTAARHEFIRSEYALKKTLAMAVNRRGDALNLDQISTSNECHLQTRGASAAVWPGKRQDVGGGVQILLGGSLDLFSGQPLDDLGVSLQVIQSQLVPLDVG